MSRNTDTPPLHEHTAVSADGTAIAYRTLGAGPDLIVVGGNLSTSDDYLPLARLLARSFTVHVVDRRGRGASGPQGSEYSLAKEVEDLHAVQAATGARLAFGHSYGGLVVLEAARSLPLFDRIAVYEPGVPCAPVPTAWMAPFRERLAAGDHYGAFVHFIQGSGGACGLHGQAAALVSAHRDARRVARAEMGAHAIPADGMPGRARAARRPVW